MLVCSRGSRGGGGVVVVVAKAHWPPPTKFLRRYHSPIQPLIHQLETQLPHFTSPPHRINLIYQPTDFYKELLTLFHHAQDRIFIASLYVGKEETHLIDALKNELRKKPSLRLAILVDYLRSTRESPRREDCSAALLTQLKNAFPDRVEIRLFHTPELFGTMKRMVPRRFDEAFGLQHMKIYGADRDLIMSGANLSHDYFTNRQDRYIKLTDQPELSDYLYELIEITSSISYQLTETKQSSEGNTNRIINIVWPKRNATSCEPKKNKTSSDQFKSEAHLLYQSFIDKWRTRSKLTTHPAPHRLVSIFPIFQFSPFRIHHETQLMIPNLIQLTHQLSTSSTPPHPPRVDKGRPKFVLHWTSGYFSLLRDYKRQMLSSDSSIQIITASPQANGFYKSRGISKLIPSAYLYLEQLFHKEIAKFNKFHQVRISQWIKPGWTYHAKGIWINEIVDPGGVEEGAVSSGQKRCLITTIGSSNYGRRSAERDLECNLLICLNHPHVPTTAKIGKESEHADKLSDDLVDELDALRVHASPVLDRLQGYRIPLMVKVLTRLIRNML